MYPMIAIGSYGYFMLWVFGASWYNPALYLPRILDQQANAPPEQKPVKMAAQPIVFQSEIAMRPAMDRVDSEREHSVQIPLGHYKTHEILSGDQLRVSQ
jgi:hypothetical protein